MITAPKHFTEYSHQNLLGMIAKNPQATEKQLAKAFGVSIPWLRRIRASDAFQALSAGPGIIETYHTNQLPQVSADADLGQLALSSLVPVRKGS